MSFFKFGVFIYNYFLWTKNDNCKSHVIGNREVVVRLSKPLRGHLRHEVIDGSFRDEAVELESLPKIFV